MQTNLFYRYGSVCLLSVLLAWSFLASALPARADTLSLGEQTAELNLESHFDVWEDRSASASLQEVMSPSGPSVFRPLPGNLSAGYTDSAFWLRLNLQRKNEQVPKNWLLEMTPVMLDDIRLYETGPGGQIREHRAGDHLRLADQEFRHRYPLFQLQLHDTAVHTMYLRIQSTSSVFFRARLLDTRQFIEHSNGLSALMGMYYGIMLAMIVYNSVLLLSYRDLSQWHYLWLSLSILMSGMSANGHIGLWLAPDWPWLVDLAPALSSQMVVLASSVFVCSFLLLKSQMPLIHRLFRLIQSGVCIFLLFIVSGFNHVIAPLAQYNAIFQIVLFLPVSLWIARRGFLPGYVVFCASLIWLCGVLLIPLRNLGLIQSGPMVDYGYQFGSAIEVILLALAQAYRIALMKKDSARVQQQMLDMSQRAEQQLESKVRQRTLELDQAIARLQTLDKEKNEFLGIAAHDLKNPLSSMIGMSELLRKCYHDIPEAQQLNYLYRISVNGERMMHIVKNLLDVNAMESGHLHLELRALNLGQIVHDVVRQYEEQFRSKDLHAHLTIPPDIQVMADSDAVMQIIDNLISNAVKYSPPGKSVFLQVEAHAPLGVLTVTDEGPGLSVEDQAHLFEKFSRLSTTPTAGEHSSGLGLSIVKKLTEAQGGQVSCQSQPGQGASFRVCLPLASAAVKPADHDSIYNAVI